MVRGVGHMGMMLSAIMAMDSLRLRDQVITIDVDPYRKQPSGRYYDAHYIAWRLHEDKKYKAQRKAKRIAEQRERDAPMIDAAEAKRQRKQAKRLK